MFFTLNIFKHRKIDKKGVYVLVNVLVNLLNLLRGYLFMKLLNVTELGVVAVFQSIILLVSTLQMGVINGGYRQYCTETDTNRQRINGFFYGFVSILTALSLVIGAIVLIF